jgi:hypothetical protein
MIRTTIAPATWKTNALKLYTVQVMATKETRHPPLSPTQGDEAVKHFKGLLNSDAMGITGDDMPPKRTLIARVKRGVLEGVERMARRGDPGWEKLQKSEILADIAADCARDAFNEEYVRSVPNPKPRNRGGRSRGGEFDDEE